MSSPSRRTRPVIQPCSDSSCIRLRVRRKVDLPQPDGPIRACTRLGGKASETPLTAVNFPYMAESLSVTMRAVGLGGASWRSGGRITAGSAIEAEPVPDGQPGAQAQHEDHQDQYQCRGPGILMPLLVGAGGVI